MIRAAALLAAACASGCATPGTYDPEPVRHALPLPDDAFDRVLEVLRGRHGRFAVAHRESFRIQTAWQAFQRGDAPGHRRATVFRDARGQLQVVVEVRYQKIGWSGPVTTPVSGDLRAEQQLAGEIERALGGTAARLP